MSSYYFIGQTMTGPISGSTGTFTGNVTVGGTLGVTGATALSSTLAAGASTLASLAVTAGATIGTTLAVTGNVSAANYNVSGLLAASMTGMAGRGMSYWQDDFLGPTTLFQATGSSAALSTTGGATGTTAVGAGFVVVSTVASSSAVSTAQWGYNQIMGAGFSSWRSRISFRIPTLSDNTEAFWAHIGAGQNVSQAAGPQRNIFSIRYKHDNNGGRFELMTNAGLYILPGSGTDTGVTVAANTPYIFDFTVTVSSPGAVGNPVTWTIYNATTNAVLASGSTTTWIGNDFSTAGHEGGPLLVGVGKTVGTTARTVACDWWEFIGTRRV